MNKEVSIRAFPGLLKRDLEKLQKRINKAVKKAAKKSANGIKKNTPKAFGDLRGSIHAGESSHGHIAEIRVSAPHAQAVEIGSSPHVVPLDELVAWVKLRRLQGKRRLDKSKSSTFDDRHGPTTREMIARVRKEFRQREKAGQRNEDQNAIDIARKIQGAIAKSGTRPHWYVRGSLDTVVKPDLEAAIREALSK